MSKGVKARRSAALKRPCVGPRLQYNDPVDDEHTIHDEYTSRVANAGEPLTLDANEEPWHTDEGTCILGTDCIAWITQGTVAVREEKHLSLVDKGIILFR